MPAPPASSAGQPKGVPGPEASISTRVPPYLATLVEVGVVVVGTVVAGVVPVGLVVVGTVVVGAVVVGTVAVGVVAAGVVDVGVGVLVELQPEITRVAARSKISATNIFLMSI